MDVLFLSHCVPNPPDKGERIRACHEFNWLAARHRVHLACFARGEEEQAAAASLAGRCASVYVERLSPRQALARAGVRFALGGCLNSAYYGSRRMQQHVAGLAGRVALDATLVFSTVMARYAPPAAPVLLDMLDVDSEKWFQYGAQRRAGFLYRLEARRLRRIEAAEALQARCTLLTTRSEELVLRSFVPTAATRYLENGVDPEYFDGQPRPLPPPVAGRSFVAFVGTMDYHPNIDAAAWFARRIYPDLERRRPGLEFFIIGRNPVKAVRQLTRLKGVTVTGAVSDIRPYLAAARAVVAPLRIARGIQNKVLEPLVMGRPVFASPAVCETFGGELPRGLVRCDTEQDFIEQVARACGENPRCDVAIREGACARFSWTRNLQVLGEALDALRAERIAAATSPAVVAEPAIM